MVNWDPQALTALSDEEVIHKETAGKLYYVKYQVVDNPDKHIIVATTRPETILGDTAICVHPEDERYYNIQNRKVLVPLINREIPIIADDYVDIEFGTGCLKITPAHDYNDYIIGEKYQLTVIDIFNDDGTLNEKAEMFIGLDRFEVRKKIVDLLDEHGLIEKIEDYTHNVGYSERTNVPIEPKLSTQWFLSMNNFAESALEVVMNDTIKFYPPKFKNLYKHWLDNIKDWCISRQLWWGHQIPAYYLPDGRFVVAQNEEEALQIAKKKYSIDDLKTSDLTQDQDVLDTWFSSWIWPLTVFDGIRNPDNKEINYYYPTNDLVTAPEILFFWVARMIMAGNEYRKTIPFKNVYFTGIVRDKIGRKMSKSFGNSPDPLELIKQYGADGVRLGMLLTSPAGNDLPFDEALCQQGRNFNNKIWNAFRLIKGWTIDDKGQTPAAPQIAIKWFEQRLNQIIILLEEHFEQYKIAEGLMLLYRVIWEDFCSWYLEIVKPAFGKPIDKTTYDKTVYFFEELMKILHPYLPFITEELWQQLGKRQNGASIMSCQYPQAKEYDNSNISEFEYAKELIITIRNIKAKHKLSPKTQLNIALSKGNDILLKHFAPILETIVFVKIVDANEVPISENVTFIVGTNEYVINIPIENNSQINIDEIQKEIAYYEQFLDGIRKKLSNEKFMSGAPAEVIAKERKKEQDVLQKLELLKKQIENK